MGISGYSAADGQCSDGQLVRVARSGPLPMAFGQERMWFSSLAGESGAQYNMSLAYRVSGPLDVQALRHSLTSVVQRHESLRTELRMHEGTPVQIVRPDARLSVVVRGASAARTPQERERLAADAAASEARRPFDFDRECLFRVVVLRFDDDDHLLILTLHHAIADGWSMDLVLRDLAVCYEAQCSGRAADLPALAIQYADYSVWQRQRLQGSCLASLVAFWRQQLAGAPACIDLPRDFARPAVQSHRGRWQRFRLSAPLTLSLKALARKERASLFTVLLAAFFGLLHRYARQDDVVVGIPVAGRSRTELEHVVGFFINTLPIRVDLSGQPTLRNLVERTRNAVLDAQTHEELPLAEIVQAIKPERTPAHHPVFQVMFGLAEDSLSEKTFANIRLRRQAAACQTSKFDLCVGMIDSADGLRGMFEYSTDLFAPDTILELTENFRRLLEAVVSNLDSPVGSLPLTGAGAQRERKA